MDNLETKLDGQLKRAMVKETADGEFTVYVPGAVRPHSVVKASSEEEALEKVRTLLLSKMTHLANKPPVEAEAPNTELEIHSGRHANNSTIEEPTDG